MQQEEVQEIKCIPLDEFEKELRENSGNILLEENIGLKSSEY
ncbi:MAG: hypothetical protein ACOCU6_03025 [Nanoarchaeota archaeon]